MMPRRNVQSFIPRPMKSNDVLENQYKIEDVLDKGKGKARMLKGIPNIKAELAFLKKKLLKYSLN